MNHSSSDFLDIEQHLEMLKDRKERMIVQHVAFDKENEVDWKLLELSLKNNISFSNFVKQLIYQHYKDQLKVGR